MKYGNQKRVLLITDDLTMVNFQRHLEITNNVLCISYGMATEEQKAELAEKQLSDDTVNLTELYLLDDEKNNYEFWINRNLIGYCSLDIIRIEDNGEDEDEDEDEDDGHPLFFASLDLVYLLPEYRGFGMGQLLSLHLSDEVVRQIIEDVWLNQKLIKNNELDISFYCEFQTEEGELFFENFMSSVLSGLEFYFDTRFPHVKYAVNIEAGI